MSRTRLIAALSIVLMCRSADSAAGQEVKWRNDYAAARKEATETGRPLLLDFSTETCFWCKKLDATTFRDPKVAKLLNDGFVAVKIDGNKSPGLAAALAIDSYPTLIVAAPEGKVFGRHAGYLDAGQFAALLARAPAPVAPPKLITDLQKQPPAPANLEALFPEIAARLDR